MRICSTSPRVLVSNFLFFIFFNPFFCAKKRNFCFPLLSTFHILVLCATEDSETIKCLLNKIRRKTPEERWKMKTFIYLYIYRKWQFVKYRNAFIKVDRLLSHQINTLLNFSFQENFVQLYRLLTIANEKIVGSIFKLKE